MLLWKYSSWFTPPDIDLTELQKTLDAQGIELVENQKESLVGRKALAEKTKGPDISILHCIIYTSRPMQISRNYPKTRKLTHLRVYWKVELSFMGFYLTATHYLIVAYQTEIDNLTKRSKTTDNAFLHIYKLLAEAPDPYPLLEAAVVRRLYAASLELLVQSMPCRIRLSKSPRLLTKKQSCNGCGQRMTNWRKKYPTSPL
jgi:homeobox protein cut-like